MLHFAKLDEDNNVLDVVAVNYDDSLGSDGGFSEEVGVSFLTNIFDHSLWKQTALDIRKNIATDDMKYDSEADGFYEPTPTFPSWSLNKDTLQWEAPIPEPDDGKEYTWLELDKSWQEIILEDGAE